MAYEVIWTPEAEQDFFAIINYLKINWSLASAEKFIEIVIAKIEKLSNMPSLGRKTSKDNFFIYKLDKRNVLFFTLESNRIVLLSIYPYKKDISKSKYF